MLGELLTTYVSHLARQPLGCNSVGYRLPKAKDLTNATLSERGRNREIGAGLHSEW